MNAPRAESASGQAMSLPAAAARLRVLTTLSNEVFFVTSADGVTMKNCFISPSVVKQLGFTAEEIFDKCVSRHATRCAPRTRCEGMVAVAAHSAVLCAQHSTARAAHGARARRL